MASRCCGSSASGWAGAGGVGRGRGGRGGGAGAGAPRLRRLTGVHRHHRAWGQAFAHPAWRRGTGEMEKRIVLAKPLIYNVRAVFSVQM